jgi:hypothetical protein
MTPPLSILEEHDLDMHIPEVLMLKLLSIFFDLSRDIPLPFHIHTRLPLSSAWMSSNDELVTETR